jgi:Ni/Co efflux regulator RcnB
LVSPSAANLEQARHTFGAGIGAATSAERRYYTMRSSLFLAGLAILCLAGAASAQPGKGEGKHGGGGGNPHGGPPGQSGGPPGHAGGQGQGQSKGDGPANNWNVRDNDRNTISSWYRDEFARGNCPPGLAKKNNGCLPPGQAKAWNVGRPLPANVPYYPLPQPLYGRLAPPPSGYDYVRVDDDILLMNRASRSIVTFVVNLR